MTDHEVDKIIDDNKETVVEMIQFWQWLQGLNKALKWLALIGLPLAVAVWGIMQALKKQQ